MVNIQPNDDSLCFDFVSPHPIPLTVVSVSKFFGSKRYCSGHMGRGKGQSESATVPWTDRLENTFTQPRPQEEFTHVQPIITILHALQLRRARRPAFRVGATRCDGGRDHRREGHHFVQERPSRGGTRSGGSPLVWARSRVQSYSRPRPPLSGWCDPCLSRSCHPERDREPSVHVVR